MHELSLENLQVILQPAGPSTSQVVNYAPVQILLHAFLWQLFGSDTTGHHVANVILHATSALLLLPLFLRAGIPLAAALAGSLLFLLHPANVEAVAWISQLKSCAGMLFALAALLAVPRRPALSCALFALALLAKPQAAFALPVGVLLAWSGGGRVPWRRFGAWAGVFALYAVAEFAAHQRSGVASSDLYDAPAVLARTLIALPLRYAVMAASGWGVSTFHELAPVASSFDPWWLASLVCLAALGWRCVVLARRRSPELAFWLWAGISYAPVSPLFPFLYQFADRYLYFMLPGFLGGALLLLADAYGRIPRPPRWAPQAGLAVAVGLAVFFAFESRGRAHVWSSPALVVADAAENYPDGVSANLLRAKRAAQMGDPDAAVAALRAAVARGYNRFDSLGVDAALAPIHGTRQFRELLEEMAADWIRRLSRKPGLTQGEYRMLARSHLVRREYAEAEAALRRGLEQGGALDAQIRADLAQVAELRAGAQPGP